MVCFVRVVASVADVFDLLLILVTAHIMLHKGIGEETEAL
jgi:hypothetical protein